MNDRITETIGEMALNVYTDGACVHPGTKRHAGVYSVFVSTGHERNAVWFTREGHVTNQTMELAAAHAGLEAIDSILEARASASASTSTSGEGEDVQGEDVQGEDVQGQDVQGQDVQGGVQGVRQQPTVYTASSYVMSCMIKWLPRWERTGWITKQRRAVQNGDMLRKMAEIKHRHDVDFEFVSIVDLIGTRPAAEGDRLPQHVRDGMANARQLLVDATSSTGGESSTPTASTTGCSKRRNVLCTWMGG